MKWAFIGHGLLTARICAVFPIRSCIPDPIGAIDFKELLSDVVREEVVVLARIPDGVVQG